MAVVGCDGKVACLIGEEVTIDFIGGHNNKMCVCVVGFLRDILLGSSKMSGTQNGLVHGFGRLGWVDQTPWQF
jgi:hypothetical protein